MAGIIMLIIMGIVGPILAWLSFRDPPPPPRRPGISRPAPRAPRPPMPGNVPVARRYPPSTRRSS
jgi:hypothetical protein